MYDKTQNKVVQTGIVSCQEEEKRLTTNLKGNIMGRRQRLETFSFINLYNVEIMLEEDIHVLRNAVDK